MEMISTFVTLMVEDPERFRERHRYLREELRFERASPIRIDRSEAMVQVIHDPYVQEEPVVENVTDQAYQTVTSAMMADPVRPANIAATLSLLEIALVNRNVPFAKFYINLLNEPLQPEDHLKVLQLIGKWLHLSDADRHLNFEPSAPPLVDNEEERNDQWMKEPLSKIRTEILLEIDKHGDYYLKRSDIADLHYQDLLAIATSDSLQVSNEMLVYSAIMRWAENECQRKCLSYEDVNVKAVLKELIYAPRYGLMTKKVFRTRTVDGRKGPDRIGLPANLNEQIIRYLSDKKRRGSLPYKLSEKRFVSRKLSKPDPNKEKVLINFLACFSAVFD